MAERDYYAILGVPRSAKAEEIRDAFRELAKKYHPDRVGPEGTAFFQDIVQAYEVLSDPQKRREYNQRLQRAEQRRAAPAAWHPGPEPLIPRSSPFSAAAFSPLAEMLRRFWGGEAVAPDLHVEITLSPEEAARGGTLPLEVPVAAVCAACGGSGRGWYALCPGCHGRGTRPVPRTLHLRVPPGVSDGTVLRLSLHGLGVPQVLRVLFRVQA
ncbi:MAG: hypothetical protein KatS3mg131_3353 [Candidatus Tectimicrobiota bacterium]|nr:MAG: hypothetical protein KatS3mg131_3353 [Candidatus Tectomicrobia bacterium]